jgi:hypothetical protein
VLRTMRGVRMLGLLCCGSENRVAHHRLQGFAIQVLFVHGQFAAGPLRPPCRSGGDHVDGEGFQAQHGQRLRRPRRRTAR